MKLIRSLLISGFVVLATPTLAAQATIVMPAANPHPGTAFPLSELVTNWLNPALASLAGSFSGGKAPLAPIAYQVWADTSTLPTTLRIWDGTNWIGFATVDTINHSFVNSATILGPNSLYGNPTGSPGQSLQVGIGSALIFSGSTLAVDTGTQGHKIPFLDSSNIWGGINIFAGVGVGGAGAANAVTVYGVTSGSLAFKAAAVGGVNTITFPAGTSDFSNSGGASRFVRQGVPGGAFDVIQPVAADVSFTQSGTGAAVGTADARFKQDVLVTDFTGVDTTGATDSAAGIANAVSTGNRKVRFPCGTYLIASAIRVPSNTEIAGAGPCTVLKAANTLALNVQQYGLLALSVHSVFVNSDYVAGNSDISIHDLTVDSGAGPNVMHSFAFYKATRITVERIKVLGSTATRTDMLNFVNSNFFKVSHSTFIQSNNAQTNGQGSCIDWWDGSHDFIVENNSCDGGGINFIGIEANGLSSTDATHPSVSNTTYNGSIAHNTVFNVTNLGIDVSGLWNGDVVTPVYGVVSRIAVVGNIIDTVTAFNCARIAEGNDISFVGNILRTCAKVGINVASSNTGTLNDSLIADNIIDNVNTSAAAAIDAIDLGNTGNIDFLNRVSVRGNSVVGTAQRWSLKINAGSSAANVALGPMQSGSSGTFSDSGTATVIVTQKGDAIPLSDHAAQAANSVVGNATGASAPPTALVVPSCSSGSQALTWTAASGFGCLSGINTGSGTVSSVGLSMPAIFTVTGSPVTTAGTLTAALANQSANLVWAGPSTGAAAAPAFRALVAADLPFAQAAEHLSFSPGLVTSISNTKGGFSKHSRASTVNNLEASAVNFTCTVNPTITMYECGADATCAAPTSIGTVTVTAAGQAFDGTIASSAISAAHYVAWAITAGTCTSLDVEATAQVSVN